jgi:entericidin B
MQPPVPVIARRAIRLPRKGNDMKAIAAILAAAVLGLISGCNTMEGAGKDVQAGGRAVERAADKANPTSDPKKY